MYAARLQRPIPFIDPTLYTNWNALCVSAALQASRVLGEDKELKFALRSLDRLLAEAADGEGRLLHVIAYAERGEGARPAGVLDDYAFSVLACLDAYEATSDARYLARAEQIAARMIAGFYDEHEGGFFDVDAAPAEQMGALAARRKPFQDSPTPAGDPAAALALLRLHAHTGEARLHELAVDTLKAFAGVAEQFGIYAGTYGLATVWATRPHTQVIVIGESAEADALYAEALRPFSLTKIVLRVKDAAAASLAPVLREAISALADDRAAALLCSGFTCQPPIYSAEKLREELQKALTP
jgi:uncharacterized protein YyaL (SSP411 family)